MSYFYRENIIRANKGSVPHSLAEAITVRQVSAVRQCLIERHSEEHHGVIIGALEEVNLQANT